GLIEGAHRGAGLGHRFLGHVERCRVLLHLVDVTGEDPVAAWRTLRDELAAYGGGLADKQEVLALTKIDAAPEGYAEDVRDALREAGAGAVTTLSSVSGAGVRDLLRQLMRTIESARAAEAAPQEPVPWSP
ncbi:MAG: GTPase ObgE, partial [Rhodobiaceae bacterium]